MISQWVRTRTEDSPVKKLTTPTIAHLPEIQSSVLDALKGNNVDLSTVRLREKGCRWHGRKTIEGRIILRISRNTTGTWRLLSLGELHSMFLKQSRSPYTSIRILVRVLHPEGHRISPHGEECKLNLSNVVISAKDYVGAEIETDTQKSEVRLFSSHCISTCDVSTLDHVKHACTRFA
ncbi:unnamed protein product [Dicrocoelium dendriticum]|nr:unnamed protein product [Dicrocoelium dendriticum]